MPDHHVFPSRKLPPESIDGIPPGTSNSQTYWRILDATRREFPHVMLNTSFFDASNPKNSDRTATNWFYIKWDSQGFTYKHLLTFPVFSLLACLYFLLASLPAHFFFLTAETAERSLAWDINVGPRTTDHVYFCKSRCGVYLRGEFGPVPCTLQCLLTMFHVAGLRILWRGYLWVNPRLRWTCNDRRRLF